MLHLQSVRYAKKRENIDRFPFNIPLMNTFDRLELKSPVTFFVGENGTGKSTLLESIAAAIGLPTVGNESVLTDRTLSAPRELATCLQLAWKKRTHRGFFLRSEDFFNFCRSMNEMRADMLARIREIDEEYRDRSDYARSLAKVPFLSSLADMKRRYGEDLDANSHGESFLTLFQNRFVPDGLYLLDEPESPLSPMRQLALLSMIREMVSQKAQFIIATHSPIIMAYPDASILLFEDGHMSEVPYDELEHVRLTRDFLNNPSVFLRHL